MSKELQGIKEIELQEVKHSAKLIGTFYDELISHGMSEKDAMDIVHKEFYPASADNSLYEIVEWYDEDEEV